LICSLVLLVSIVVDFIAGWLNRLNASGMLIGD
jgi:hypothetical protein